MHRSKTTIRAGCRPPGWYPAQDAQAKENLTATADAAQAIRDESGSFSAATWAQLYDYEPSLLFVGGASSGDRIMGLNVSPTRWGAAALSDSGHCFLIRLDDTTGRTYGTTNGWCSGKVALSATDPTWP